MDPRGHSWYGPGPQFHPSGQSPRQSERDREDVYYRHHHGQGHYPSLDPRERERERQWYSPDPGYRHHLTSPPSRPEFIPNYSSIPQSSQGFGPNRALPHSRQAYDYPPQSYWDYREDYGYYGHSYYRGHYGYQEASGWSGQDAWRPEVGGREQEWAGATYSDQQGHHPRRASVQYDHGVSGGERRESIENGYGAGGVCEPGGLARSKTSGLSSSSYELSQYMNGAEQTDAVPASHLELEAEPKSVAPLKFCVPHVAVSFGPAGQLVRVSPALPSQGEPAQVELHSLEVILSDTHEQQDMRNFPGPLAREDLHKVDVINFALQMADGCLKEKTRADDSSAALLWHLLVLLCRQNGRIVGSDIAELLVRGMQSLGACEGDRERSDIGSLIDLNEAPTPETESLNTADLLTGNPFTEEQTSEQNLQDYTKLLLAGRKKEALESAMRSGLWGHALFLASKMDSRAYTTVLGRFTGSLATSDPLQTLFQLLSGRIPAVAMCYSREKWGDWRRHLAVILSNEVEDSDMYSRSINTLGDTLASKGLLHAAHVCYLTAHSPFGWFTNKAQRLVLLGSSHGVSFAKFCQNAAIRCTEVFEYCQRLGNASFFIPSFQVYKFLYACRLLDCGLTSQAFHYCEVVGKALLKIEEPHIVLLEEVIKLVDRIKNSEAQLSDTGDDPTWLALLRQQLQDMQQMGRYDFRLSAPEGNSWAEESREFTDLNPTDLSTSEELIQPVVSEASYNGVEENHYEHSQSAAQQPHSFFPAEEQSYLSYSPDEHSLAPANLYCPEEQLSQTYDPVPMYSPQNSLAQPPIQPLGMPGLPLEAVGQDGANQFSYHPTAADLIPRSCSNTGAEFSTDRAMIFNTPENRTTLTEDCLDRASITEAYRNEASQKPEKESKSGWFSGWFRSKPKETLQDQSVPVKPAPTDPPSSPTLPPTKPPGPMVNPSMLTSQPQAAGINPFSMRAGQKRGGHSGQNFGPLPQGH